MLRLDPTTVVLELDRDAESGERFVHPRACLDDCPGRRSLNRVHEDVEEHLIDFARMTENRRQEGEIGSHLNGVLLDLVSDDFERRLQGSVEVGLLEIGFIEPSEIAQVLDDVAHTLETIERTLEQTRQTVADVGQIDVLSIRSASATRSGATVRNGSRPSRYLSNTCSAAGTSRRSTA